MRKASVPVLLLSFVLLAVASIPAEAQGPRTVSTRLRGFDEVPAVATRAGGRFSATIDEDENEIEYTLRYRLLEGAVTQAHIHLGQDDVNGGIMVFLCSNLGNGPAGTQACPAGNSATEAVVTGTITASDVIAVAAQGVAAGEFFTLERAIRAGIAYVNVHSTLFPGGEIRGQLDLRGGGQQDLQEDLLEE
ncbi:MAG TPA: CHRD domain-containing protein [Thermoanaerobaculia bacterium]|nr:CHRD domain-containing protein [Thermoanaerobaculia bacterium]